MAAKPIDDIERKLAKLPKPQAAYLRHQLEWTRTARVSQMPPSHDEQEAWLARVNEGCDTDALVAACMDPKVPWTEFGVQAGRGAGKGLALDTPIPTPAGFKPLAAIQTGDIILDELSRPCRVVKAHDPYQPHDMFRLRFSHGYTIDADGDHLWSVVAFGTLKRPAFVPSEWYKFAYTMNTRALSFLGGTYIIPRVFSFEAPEPRIASVEEIDPVTVRCLTVDSPSRLYLAGEGMIPTHNTRLGAEWLARDAWEDPQALPRSVIAPTQNDVRLTCFEGESGLMNIIPPECVANYNRSELILTLANDAIIRGFSAEKPDRLRGPQSASGWGDEIAAWGVDGEETLDMFMFGLRLGPLPRFLWTSTPRPIPIVRKLTTPKPGRIIVRGSTYDNKDNLAKAFLDRLSEYDGTRMGRQEIYGELIDPEEAGIIRRSWFRLWPHDKPLPRFEWIIMSLDTAFTERTLDKKGDPDPTACGVWGVFRHEKRSNVMLLDCWEDFLGLPDLARRVKREMNTAYGDDEDAPMIKPLFGSPRQHGAGRKPDILLIEDKGSGISLRQTLAEQGIEAYAYNPGRADKLARLHIVSPIFAQKRVWLPESEKKPGAPKNWAEPLVEQLCSFAGTGSLKHDDHIDATTQCIRLCMDKRLLEVSPPSKEEREARQHNEAKRLSRGPAVNPYAQ